MKYPIYAVRDIHVGFNAPMTDINDQVAIRNFTYAINNPGNEVMNFAPKDYDLYRLGEFDTESGHIVVENVPVLIVTGSSVFGSEVK